MSCTPVYSSVDKSSYPGQTRPPWMRETSHSLRPAQGAAMWRASFSRMSSAPNRGLPPPCRRRMPRHRSGAVSLPDVHQSCRPIHRASLPLCRRQRTGWHMLGAARSRKTAWKRWRAPRLWRCSGRADVPPRRSELKALSGAATQNRLAPRDTTRILDRLDYPTREGESNFE